jgi:hypothetical protein
MVYSIVYTVTDLDTVGKVVGGLVLESNGLQKMIDRAYKDPIAGILLKNSNITVTQYETLIIDYLTTNASNIEITFKNKALYRSKKVSRGSFSRTLSQARGNVISSLYTLLLLAYLGIFDTVPFDDYRNLAEKLIEYRQLIDLSGKTQSAQFLRRIERELIEGIKMLAEPRSLSTL